MNKAISCPNCGATTGHKEDIPNRYICAYCDTVFEHLSYIPSQQLARFSYDYLIELLEKTSVLDRKSKNYRTDSFSLLIQMPELIKKIKDQELTQKALDAIASEIDLMKTEGYHHKNEYSITSGKFPYTELYILSQYHFCLAQLYCTSNYEERNRHKAIDQCDISLLIQEKYLGGASIETNKFKEIIENKF